MSSEESSRPVVQLGVSRAIITPPVGIPLMGTLRDALSDDVQDDLTITALYLSNGATALAIAACDLIRVSTPTADAVRTRVAAASTIPFGNIFLNASHTHAVPAPPDWYEYDGELDNSMRLAVERYYGLVEDQMVAAIVHAMTAAQPGRLGAGLGAVRIGVNRREFLPDGTAALGENPLGPLDPTVTVVRFDDMRGSPVAVLFHHACHPDVLGPKCRLISPDYVGAARRTVEAISGCPALFLQGAAGDIDPRCGIVNPPDGVDALVRLGSELGCEVGRVYHTINTTRVRDRRVAWPGTLSAVTGWNYTDVANRPVSTFSAGSRSFDMPLRELPPLTEAERMLDEAERQLSELESRSSMLSDRLRARRRVAWARMQREAVRLLRPSQIQFEMGGFVLDDLAFIGCPAELFVEIGLRIKDASPVAVTMVSGYTNGCHFYVPTRAAFAEGGYEIESHRNYLQPAGPTPDWEDILTERAAGLLSDLLHGALHPTSVGSASPSS